MSKIVVSQVQASPSAPTLTLPTTAPTAGQLIQSDSSGNLSFTSAITAATNITASGNITAAKLIADQIQGGTGGTALTLPTADGTAGQFLQTNGSGVLSFQSVVVSAYGTTAPTASTAGFIGEVYVNTVTLIYYICIGIRSPGSYQWVGSNGTVINVPQGQQAYTTPGTYSWTCPADVYAVSVVCVGGGGGGYNSWANPAGSGGGLGWKNSISVVPGTSYTVVVGAAGAVGGSPTAGGNSYFISTGTVAGYGGGNAGSGAYTSGPNANSTYGGGYYGDGGGAGGYAAGYQGGGGAGGYSGQGGNTSANGAGGGGGGGSYYSSTYGCGAGGGVGILGGGTSGLSGSNRVGNGYGGGGGSGGANGANGEPASAGPNAITGGAYGGGGGGPGTSYGGGSGGVGAVRIIWGLNRAFPATNTADVTPVS